MQKTFSTKCGQALVRIETPSASRDFDITISNQSSHALMLMSKEGTGFDEAPKNGHVLYQRAADRFRITPTHSPWGVGAVTIHYQMLDEPLVLTVVGHLGSKQAFSWTLSGQGTARYECHISDTGDGSAIVLLEGVVGPHLMGLDDGRCS